jgi:molybdopterin-guanine dinucleotide biosynthesis protein A
MGTAKADLDWFGAPLLYRTASVLARVATPVVIVRAPGQDLPDLPPEIEVAEDADEGRGPLAGMAAGMRALAARASGDRPDAVFVSSTDVPLLHPAFVRSVAEGLGGADVALPVVDGRNHPLSAVYRLALLPKIEALLAQDRLRPAFVWEDAVVVKLTEADLVHPESVRNVNTPDELAQARALPLPEVEIQAFGTIRTKVGTARTDVRAATLGAALSALPSAGLDPDHLLVSLNGEGFRSDPRTALVEGDSLALLSPEAGG